VAQIITFGNAAGPRGVLRDVGPRAARCRYGQVDKLWQSSCPAEPPLTPSTLRRAIDDEAAACQAAARERRSVGRARAFGHRAKKLEGTAPTTPSNTCRPAIVIGERPPHRDGAALIAIPKSKHAGDPIQHEMGSSRPAW